eukprot:CAMPEP_0168755816 /NCGR_PEP_ID=MMETSP0724-20121128/20272_1 /TAXON_ID=265536 /ORGANISM="Amphiprora sp., Strain CCMP467" /LENGTH=543 /DNA_ID=CAMNT_0008804459 /DNA_START=121 /DNA_END=1751 /DNA_ORIENTATION=-
MTTLKQQKEAFVSGHQGTSPQEIGLILLTVPLGFWLSSALRRQQQLQRGNSGSLSSSVASPLEAVTFYIPMILCQSSLLYPYGVIYMGLQAVVAAGLEWWWWTLSKPTTDTFGYDPPASSSSIKNNPPKQPSRAPSCYLTHYRSSLLYLTFCAILAVDFPFFPRRLAKTETAGYGLMDLGAASFVFAAGLVSHRAKQQQHQQRQQSKTNHNNNNNNNNLQRRLRRCVPLDMGLLRLATHKGMEYQEHASEYGVHWNFFFTLALLPWVVGLIPSAAPSWITPFFLLSLYQWFLSAHNVQEWIEQAPRTCGKSTRTNATTTTSVIVDTMLCLFVANREGVLGCIGYAAIYMAGEWIGQTALWPSSSSSSSLSSSKTITTTSRLGALWLIWLLSVALWLGLTQGLGIAVSRRSTNASFCCWVLVVNLPILGFLQIIDHRHGQYDNDKTAATAATAASTTVTTPQATLVSQAVNRHGLLCFIVANLLTGAVNLSMNTLEASNTTAFVVLLGYLTVVGTLATVLEAIVASRRQAGNDKNGDGDKSKSH